MKILGIDPGMAIVGYSILEFDGKNIELLHSGSIQTEKGQRESLRLLEIFNDMTSIVEKYKPDVCAIAKLFFVRNITTALPVSQARGVILVCAIKECGRLYEYTPLQIKQSLTGNGRADKKQMQFMVTRLLNLKAVPKPDDAADGLAVALTHGQTARLGGLFGIK